MISFEVDGILTSLAKFAELETATVAATKVGEDHTAEAVLAKAKQFVPVETGRLRDSLHIEQDEQGALVGTDVEYAVFVEFGGANAAEPFLRPAADEAGAGGITDAVQAAIRAVAGL